MRIFSPRILVFLSNLLTRSPLSALALKAYVINIIISMLIMFYVFVCSLNIYPVHISMTNPLANFSENLTEK